MARKPGADRTEEYTLRIARRKQLLADGLCKICAAPREELKFVRCKKCRVENGAQSKKFKSKQPNYMKRYMRNLKMEVLNAYGGPVCKCCGETNAWFLTIDHINNNGAEDRKANGNRTGGGLAWLLRKKGFPPGYQILCYNCNLGRARNGGICPHVSESFEKLVA